MSIIQTEYPNFHQEFVDGQVANTQTCDIDSTRVDADSANVPFGRIVQPVEAPASGSAASVARDGRQRVQLGASRRQIATVNGAINNSATTLVVDAPTSVLPGMSALGVDRGRSAFIVVGTEILEVTAATATNLTVVRGALGSTAAAIANDAEVLAFESIIMAGIAVSDQRLPATSNAIYTPGEVLSALWRGDVATLVSAQVRRGDHVVVATAASGTGNTAETIGQLSAKAPDATHILIPHAEFVRDTSAQEISVVRLSGPQS